MIFTFVRLASPFQVLLPYTSSADPSEADPSACAHQMKNVLVQCLGFTRKRGFKHTCRTHSATQSSAPRQPSDGLWAEGSTQTCQGVGFV